MHEHFQIDEDTGEHTRCRAAEAHYTIVTREAEWDEESRGRALRLAEYERSLCPCGCGHPMDVAHDPKRVMGVAKYTCMASRAVAIQKRKDEAAHKDDRPTRDGDRWDDGLNYHAVPQET